MIPIIINGIAKSGKDTFIDYCAKYIPIINISSIDQLNSFAKEIGWNGKKTDEYRKFISELKKLVVQFNDAPTKYILEQIELYKEDEGLIFIHIREPEEINKIKQLVPCFVVLIERDVSIPKNDSDQGVLEFQEYDFTIKNNSDLNALERSAKCFLDALFDE